MLQTVPIKILFAVILFFNFCFLYGQEINDDKISINFKNSIKVDIINQIEKKTNYKFYFLEKWLDNIPVSGNYEDVSLATILDDVFKKSVINYYVSPDNKVILTKNSLIHSSLPNNFFLESKQTDSRDQNITPFFHTNETNSKERLNTVVKIGKESKNSKSKSFVLSGYVTNIVTNKPIPNLVLSIKDKNINVVTDSLGYYFINLLPGMHIIESKALGFKSKKKKVIIYSSGLLNFNLEEDTETFDEIVIDAKKDINVKEAVTGITRINVEKIKNIPLVLGERDILKVSITLPGIKTAGEGSSGYSVRGGKEDQNLILLNNGVLYNPSHFFGIFSAVNPFTTNDVKIYKGSAPVEYGGRLSSVFDISTKNANNQKFSGEASIGPVTSNVSLEIPIVKNKSSLLLGGRGAYSNWVLKSLKKSSLKNSSASFYDVVAKYTDSINENNDIEATGYFSNDTYSISSDSLYSYNNRLITLKWKHRINDKNNGELILANSEYKFNIGFDSNSNSNFDLEYKIMETQLKLKMKYQHNNIHKFEYGISSKLYNVNPGSKKSKGSVSIVEPLKIPKEKALESSLFISDNIKVNKKLLLNFGIRYSLYNTLGKASQKVYFDGLPKNEGTIKDTLYFKNNEIIKTNSKPEIRTSVRYLFNPSFSIKASYNNTYQYIQSLSNNTTLSPTTTWKLSDLNIKPQESNQFTLGFYKNINNNIYELSLEGYYKKSKNILDYKVGADLLLNKSIETEVLQGDGKAYGVEFLIKKTKGKLNGWLGYSYSRSLSKFESPFNEERINNGEYFSANFDKPHDLSLVTNYKLTKRFSLSTNFIYQTGRPVTYPVGQYNYNGAQYVYYSDHNKHRIPDYYRLDVGLNIEGNHKIKKFIHSFWNISVYNVLGRNNPYSVFFVTENGKVKAYKSSIFSIAIPTITYNFKF